MVELNLSRGFGGPPYKKNGLLHIGTFWGPCTPAGYMGQKSEKKKNRKISKMPKNHQKWFLA